MSNRDLIIDDLDGQDLLSRLGTRWRGVSDRVMGGVSQATVVVEQHAGRRCLRLSGEVSLENNGGFVQMALDLDPHGGFLDASGFSGIRLAVHGNAERYSVHLRSADALRPWQSYRAEFEALAEWREVRLPFSGFAPYRLQAPLDLTRLRRVGVVAIGRAFTADLGVAEIALYR